jgi:inward rectifier potassium channel
MSSSKPPHSARPQSDRPRSEKRKVRPQSNVPTTLINFRSIGRTLSPFHDFYHFILTRSWGAFFIIVTALFAGANAIFACIFLVEPGSISTARAGSFEDAFYFSVQTMATIGYGGMAPVTRFAHIIVAFEAVVGILGVALVTGMTFAKFARPTARILFSEPLIVGKRNGVPHLMFRIANWRQNQIVEAQIRVLVLTVETTSEGETIRTPRPIQLTRDRNELFSLSWLVMHKIDESSPFYGEENVKALIAGGGDIFVAMSGLDETIGQNIHSRFRYSVSDIVWNARFIDILTVLEDGTREIDYTRFHDIEKL